MPLKNMNLPTTRRTALGLLAALLLGGAGLARAQLSIQITGAGANQIPVAIADFGGDPGTGRALTSDPETAVLVAGDKKASYESVLVALDEIKALGFKRVGLETSRSK